MISPAPRVGCVPYLNARPLLEGLPFSVRKLVPAQLHDVFLAGELDVALLSSIDVISKDHPEVVDGVSISSRGDVHSVVLAYEGELKDLSKVTLDPASHTSNALLRIVLEEFHGIIPQYVQLEQVKPLDIPALIIGDRAIKERKRTSGSALRYLDLGGEWYRHTGLPFVFAIWELASSFTKKEELSELLRAAKFEGLDQRAKIAAQEADPDFALRYLTESIRYDLAEEEKRGLALFRESLEKMKIIPEKKSKIIYY